MKAKTKAKPKRSKAHNAAISRGMLKHHRAKRRAARK